MENRALRVSWIIATVLMMASVVCGVVFGFAGGKTALGFVLCVGVPAVLASPAAAFRSFDRKASDDSSGRNPDRTSGR
ncbi:MAG TPA: hypothetical protein VMW87_06430 [Spirochaetia bacterium]|nr:hypothetical protein [Spirochaetia bacterium]